MGWVRGCFSNGLFAALLIVCSSIRAQEIKITVLEGEGAVNNIKLRRAKEPLVRIDDSDGRPVRGAAVSFVLPAHGAGGYFGSGELSLTVTTTADGLAAARGLKPNRLAGTFQIRVTGSSHGKMAIASVSQTNVEPAAEGHKTKVIALVALAGGAAVGGIIAATHGGRGTPAASAVTAAATPPAPGGTTIVPGTPGFGPPGGP